MKPKFDKGEIVEVKLIECKCSEETVTHPNQDWYLAQIHTVPTSYNTGSSYDTYLVYLLDKDHNPRVVFDGRINNVVICSVSEREIRRCDQQVDVS